MGFLLKIQGVPICYFRILQSYAHRNLALADVYTKALPAVPALDFCQIMLALAYAKLNVLAQGEDKLSRGAVLALIEQVTKTPSNF